MNRTRYFVLIFMLYFLVIPKYQAIAVMKTIKSENMYRGVPGKVLDGEGINGSDIFYAVTEDCLYRTVDGGKNWERVVLPPGVRNIKDLVVTRERLFITTSSGVYAKRYGGEWERILGKEVIKGVSMSGEYSEGSEFSYNKEDEEGAGSEDIDPEKITFLKKQTGSNGEDNLWLGSGGKLHKIDIGIDLKEELNGIEKFQDTGEITVREVQEMAVEYAEVSPEKIKRWRKGAKWKAFLPKLNLGFSESVDDNVEIYKNSTTSYVVTGPRETDNDWGIDLSWDLSDIIWNDVQTNIDVRSKLMVQLREDILEEVTRLYFERKRMLSEVKASNEKGPNSAETSTKERLDKMLRVEEITAYIDALTGGKFSAALTTKTKA